MEQAKGIYRQRHPEQTACYKIFENHYKSFKDSYEERYEWRYGYFRTLVDEEVAAQRIFSLREGAYILA